MFGKTLIGASCALMAFACVTQSEEDQVIDETIDNLIEAGFPADDIQIYDNRVFVGHDAEVSLEASYEMLVADDSSDEQYRTNNLISRGLRTICVNGIIFTGTLSTGLDRAIQNYNQLGLTFNMRRITFDNSGCNAVIRASITGGTGGSAGFPSGGRPFGTINIGFGTSSLGADVVEHVITHELGHTIGFRHSDFFNRSISCGSGGNEGDGGVGAIHIPGTPQGAQVGGSIMNSCFRSNENGEFTGSDRTALRRLY